MTPQAQPQPFLPRFVPKYLIHSVTLAQDNSQKGLAYAWGKSMLFMSCILHTCAKGTCWHYSPNGLVGPVWMHLTPESLLIVSLPIYRGAHCFARAALGDDLYSSGRLQRIRQPQNIKGSFQHKHSFSCRRKCFHYFSCAGRILQIVAVAAVAITVLDVLAPKAQLPFRVGIVQS